MVEEEEVMDVNGLATRRPASFVEKKDTGHVSVHKKRIMLQIYARRV